MGDARNVRHPLNFPAIMPLAGLRPAREVLRSIRRYTASAAGASHRCFTTGAGAGQG